jgi:hypothetical protein
MNETLLAPEATCAAQPATYSSALSQSRTSHCYLSKAAVGELYDAASFLVQDYGVALNVRIVLRHRLLGSDAASGACALVSDLVHELGMTLKRWAPRECRRFHWLYAHARGETTGLITTVVAHVPPRLQADAEEWLFDRFLAKRVGWPLPAGAVQMRVTHHKSPPSAMRRHNQLVRLLCRSVDPDAVVRVNGDRRRLIDVLRIPAGTREKLSPPGTAQIKRVSKTLGKQARAACTADHLAPLSVFDDGAWDFLMSGWELFEHQDRQRERAERAKAFAALAVQWPQGMGLRQDQMRSEALRALVVSWPMDPKQRLRTWRGWWLADVSYSSGVPLHPVFATAAGQPNGSVCPRSAQDIPLMRRRHSVSHRPADGH